jgi:hypothetical protein
MSRCRHLLLLAAATLSAGACELGTDLDQDTSLLDSAFSSVLLGYNNVQSSFATGTGDEQTAWTPRGGQRDGGARAGGGMCAGGLGGPFLGTGFGLGFGRGRFGDAVLSSDCAFDAGSARVVCPVVTRNGLTIHRFAAYADASGDVQSAFDSLTTNTINVRIAASGTVTRRNGATSTVEHASDRTVTGLAPGSMQRTVNGTSAGTETTSGSNDHGSFTAVRVLGDTTTNVIIPVQTGTHAYPTAGTIVRSMQVTLTYAGQEPVTSTRREVVTFNGTATASVAITRDGQTKNCTLPLPRGRLTCE